MYLSQHTSFLFVVFFKGECQDSDDGKTELQNRIAKKEKRIAKTILISTQ